MDIADFNLIVLPLGILVFGLVGAIYIILRREDIEQKQKVKRIAAYLKERSKQQGILEKEAGRLDRLHERKMIDDDAYERLRVLVGAKQGEDQEVVEILSYMTKK